MAEHDLPSLVPFPITRVTSVSPGKSRTSRGEKSVPADVDSTVHPLELGAVVILA